VSEISWFVSGEEINYLPKPNGGSGVYYPSNMFRNTHSFKNWGISLGFSPVLDGEYTVTCCIWSNIIVRQRKHLMDHDLRWPSSVIVHAFPSCIEPRTPSKLSLVHSHSCENEFTLHVNEISFSYEKMGTKTRFKKEAKGNSELAYIIVLLFDRQACFHNQVNLW